MANATFKPLAGGALGTSGIIIGSGATVTVAANAVLTLTGNASINGSTPNNGVIAFVDQNVSREIGETVPLMSVKLDQYVGGPHALAYPVHATTLDITGGTQVSLDTNVSMANITGGITSSDSSSRKAAMTQSIATYAGGNGNVVNVGNLGVMTNITGAGTLIAQNVAPNPNLMGAQNDVVINFSANGAGTFQLNNAGAMINGAFAPGAVSDIKNTSTVANTGTFIAQLTTNAPNVLNLTGPIGGAGNATLNTLTFNGAGLVNPNAPGYGYYTNINMPAGDVYAQTVNLTNTAMHATAGNINIYSTNCSLTNALLDAAGNTITVTGGNVALNGNIVIQAIYTGNPNISALNLSAANITATPNAITFNISNYNTPPVSGVSTMTMINLPAGFNPGAAPTISFPPNGPAGYWQPIGHGVIMFVNPVYNPGTQPNQQISQGQLSGIFNPDGTPNSGVNFTIPDGSNIAGLQQAAAGVIGGLKPTGLNGSFLINPGNPGQPESPGQPGQQISMFAETFAPNGLNLPSGTSLPVNGQFQLPLTAAGDGFGQFNAPPGIAQVANAVLAQYSTETAQVGVQIALASEAIANPGMPFAPTDTVVLATTMSARGLMPAAMANSIFNQGGSGMSPELASDITAMGVIDPAKFIQIQNTLNNVAQNATNVTSSAVSSRMAFVNIPIPTFAPPPPPPANFATPPAGAGVNFAAPANGPQGGGQFNGQPPSAGGPQGSPEAGGPPPSGGNSGQPSAAGPQGGQAPNAGNATNASSAQEQANEEQLDSGTDLQALAQGIAAGSSPYDKFGVWGSVNTGVAHQKMRKGNDGFKSISDGLAIGVDTMINDLTSIGATVSYSMNHIKHKDASAGNKTDSSSWVGAVYGNRQLKNNWFIRGTALFNRTHINDKTLVPIAGGSGLAQSKYNMISYGADASVGFAHTFANQLTATPTVGLRVIHSNKTSYSQFGNTHQNTQNLTQKAANNYSALAGVSVARTFVKDGINFTPEAHANFQYGINVKGAKGSYVSPLSPTDTTTFVGTKSVALNSTYGLSLTGSHDRIEAGISGDVTIASKYVGYQGALKLKVKF